MPSFCKHSLEIVLPDLRDRHLGKSCIERGCTQHVSWGKNLSILFQKTFWITIHPYPPTPSAKLWTQRTNGPRHALNGNDACQKFEKRWRNNSENFFPSAVAFESELDKRRVDATEIFDEIGFSHSSIVAGKKESSFRAICKSRFKLGELINVAKVES
ncbi:hypothetical protein CEXT_74451 [Caerostris extrusa]|uniref:Uncharacterized protein n=1 Tax=Caerostris extrusa TaxID=172846 RepID=A0AAV4VET9_CAEEX|nr:hypothetical protein CEXT_74451 [Caerostris extrusa]